MRPDDAPRPRLAFIGAGRVAGALARLWHARGYTISAVASRTYDHARRLALAVDARTFHNPLALIDQADIICLSVPDDAIQTTAARLIEANWHGRSVIHFSGAHSLGVLRPLAERGAMVGSLHPAFPFASAEQAARDLPGAAFAIEADDDALRQQLITLVAVLDGQRIDLPPGAKAAYHAALSIASNYTVTLYAIAEQLLSQATDAPSEAISQALNALMRGTVDNLTEQGIPAALTGPLVRADLNTLAAHLDALKASPDTRSLYVALAQATYPLLAARQVAYDEIEQLFEQESTHASDHP